MAEHENCRKLFMKNWKSCNIYTVKDFSRTCEGQDHPDRENYSVEKTFIFYSLGCVGDQIKKIMGY